MALLNFFINYYTVIATLVVARLIALLYKTKYSYWKSRGVPGPTPLPLIGLSIDFLFDSVATVSLKHSKKYGRVHGAYEALSPKLVVSDPKLVKQICIKDFHIFTNRRRVGKNFHKVLGNMMSIAMDNEWRRLRKIISPTFTTGKIKRMKPLIEICLENALEHLDLIAAKKEQLNLKQFWSRFTLEVIGRCAFAVNINSHKDPDNEFYKNIKRMFLKPGMKQLMAIFLLFTLPAKIFKLLRIEVMQSKSIDFVSSVVIDLLKRRRETNSNHNDFLQLLIEAEKESEDKNEPPLTEDEIIANCILFFRAGYETTAALLQWACFALAIHPEIQQKVYDELKGASPDEKSIDYDVANKLPYFDAFVSETLRMYPPAVSVDRTANADIEIGDTGITIPATTVVTIPIYAIHHDPEFYPEPEIFNPERFLGENKDNIDPYSHLPFGVGPRNCVAKRFALFEAKLALIHTILNFKIEKCNKTPSTPKFLTGSQALVTKDIFVKVVNRRNEQ